MNAYLYKSQRTEGNSSSMTSESWRHQLATTTINRSAAALTSDVIVVVIFESLDPLETEIHSDETVNIHQFLDLKHITHNPVIYLFLCDLKYWFIALRACLTTLLVGFPAPWPALVSTRIMSGLVCLGQSRMTCCSCAMYLREWRGTTRSSWSAVNSSVAGYCLSPSGTATLWSGELLQGKKVLLKLTCCIFKV